jgi:hypothetical protein
MPMLAASWRWGGQDWTMAHVGTIELDRFRRRKDFKRRLIIAILAIHAVIQWPMLNSTSKPALTLIYVDSINR